MSGHSKWATTKHKKAAIDARRGKLFAKLIKNIEVAARTGGGDPAGNPTLYDAIQKAKKSSVPNDNIDRAVKRGSGAEAGGADWQTITYEGYAPHGVAVLIECLTDNRNRAAAEVRTALTRNGGTAGRPRLGLLPVHPQGRRHRAQGLAHRGRAARGRPRRRRRGGQRPRRVLRGHLRGLGLRRGPQGPAGRRDRLRLGRARVRPQRGRSRSTWTAPARSSASSTPSRTPTTSRTSGPTATSATRSSPQLDAE